ncbi:pyridoxal phosphate-dependent aminotransferase [Microlunatus soli]|uniref:Histidinol-phosphate aminotransferase n=1 Tax=Microlunatus soli TaxID=630515 RepID=A0A1H1RTV5_9ACTN|nr:histidinol-phosphate transaminase [Microlunatus soli]SDS39158.1 histidinol-phosphate aminotransferase [Microlunatus soli]
MTAAESATSARPWAAAARRLADVPGYQPGRAAPSEIGKLSSNEAPLGASPRVRSTLQEAARGVHRYPNEADFSERLAAEVGVDPDRLLLTNGSDELCSLLGAAFLEPGDRVISSVPAYGIDLKVTALAAATLFGVPLQSGGHDLAALATASAGARLLWLPSPHNPTGAAIPVDGLRQLLDDVDPACFVILDEAYRGYVARDRRPDIGLLLAEHPNLVVQRTFSKDHALAGLRLGYGIAAAPIIDLLRRVRGPFSVNGPALAAANAALDDHAWHDFSTAMVITERERLSALLTELEIDFVPSQANFVTARIPHATMAEQLSRHGLTVRPGETLGLPGWVRISIGTPQAMTELRRLLRHLFSTPTDLRSSS